MRFQIREKNEILFISSSRVEGKKERRKGIRREAKEKCPSTFISTSFILGVLHI
jgi:hypothetical protein